MGKVLRIVAASAIAWSCCTNYVVEVMGAQHQPVRNLHITLRGKKYDVTEDVVTVRDLQNQIKQMAPSKVTSPQSVLFDGRRLRDDDVLSEAGVTDGAQLNMVPASAPATTSSTSSSSSSAPTSTTKSKKKAEAKVVSSNGDVVDGSADAKMDSIESAMQDYLKQAGVDPSQLEDLMKNFGGEGGGDGKMPDMKESLEMMNSMMQSDLFQSYMSDPDKLEQSRQMILGNPMLKSMMASMPGMDQILNDPVAWREAMQAAASMYKNMDPDTLMSMMSMGGAGASPGGGGVGGGGGMEGLFGGTLDPSSTAAAAALDELDEDE